MDLEHLTKIPCDSTHKQFYQYENGSQLHQIEYVYHKIEGSNLVLVTKVPYSDKIIPVAEPPSKGYQNWL